jgi:hypothetical protein
VRGDFVGRCYASSRVLENASMAQRPI